ncbi:hypothetical protein THAOC_19728 [Thalassiosira oceanica]|uniref:Uncharacterized protein n=1 Tax=Thalassiosira oceanica TaxID=159749 RepID=K0SGA2_THAOC|nr:hypothetical protein THAOC_19728 [Thalassiosira oceanica]|eukprot:EJK59996.1 hypothetical protein THAOC_19728 [Thalassiosira oceanica]
MWLLGALLALPKAAGRPKKWPNSANFRKSWIAGLKVANLLAVANRLGPISANFLAPGQVLFRFSLQSLRRSALQRRRALSMLLLVIAPVAAAPDCQPRMDGRSSGPL